MQNKEILEALLVNAKEENPKYSFVIDNNQTDKVIGDAKNNLEINNYIIKNVIIIFNTAQVVIIRSNTYNPTYGWESNDSALMFSCIKKIYKGEKLVFDCTKK
jgi:ABC-type enterochelin transport system substrate-binding protein